LVIFGLGFVASEKFAGLISKGSSRYNDDEDYYNTQGRYQGQDSEEDRG